MLAERTFLVVVSTPDLDSAHRIFSASHATPNCSGNWTRGRASTPRPSN
ncbi:hypothetical protein ACG5V6_13960 [Streptomyces chitinivorans]|uniref:Uncharacterized protein n=1 Tax=Streptomyces chitinivorans TaxID=1257027 RepID=A0ABW7HTZ9_9ACTN